MAIHLPNSGGVPREYKMLKGHLTRVTYHKTYYNTKIIISKLSSDEGVASVKYLSLVSGNPFIIVYTLWKTLVNSLAGVASVEPPSRSSEQAQITMQITTQMLH